MYCIKLFINKEFIFKDDIIGLEADGEFVTFIPLEDQYIPINRIPLVRYYQRNYGFSPDIEVREEYYEHVPMRTDIRTVLSYCSL